MSVKYLLNWWTFGKIASKLRGCLVHFLRLLSAVCGDQAHEKCFRDCDILVYWKRLATQQYQWGLSTSESCSCGQKQTMSHYSRLVSIVTIWRRFTTTPHSWRSRSSLVGDGGEKSTREINKLKKRKKTYQCQGSRESTNRHGGLICYIAFPLCIVSISIWHGVHFDTLCVSFSFVFFNFLLLKLHLCE